MGWQDAPIVGAAPKWQQAPIIEQAKAPDSAATRFARGAAQPVVGAAQLMSRPLAAAGEVIGSDYLQSLPQQADMMAAAMRENAARGAPEGIDWASLAGQTATTLPLGGLKILQAAGKAAPLIQRAITTAVNSGAQGALTGAALGNTNDAGLGANATAGGIAGALTPAALKVAGRMIAPEADSAAAQLAKAGVQMTPGQIAGGFAKRLEDAATSIPLVGDVIRSAQRRSFESFNRAAINKTLEPIGVKLPKDAMGRDAIAFGQEELGKAYDTLLPQLSAKADNKFVQDLTALRALSKNLPDKERDQFEKILQTELVQRMPQGNASGETLKAIESELGRQASGLRASADFYTRELGNAVQEMQSTLRSLVARSNPQKAAELKKINSGYAMFKRVEDAASRTTSEGGIFTPEALSSAVRKLDRTRGKTRYARGDALMQDFSDTARDVLGRKVPDSGTAMRAFTGAAGLGGLGYLEPHSALAAGATMIPYAPGVSNALQALMLSRPAGANRLAQLVGRSSPVAIPFAIPATEAALYNGP